LTESQQTFIGKLTDIDKDLVKTFQTLTHVEDLKQFSSDDFRRFGLDRFLRGNPSHAIGGFFAKLIKNKLVREVGRTRSKFPSNHWREIRVYEWIK